MPGIGSIISDLFGEEKMARQFFVWTVASSVVQAVLEPYFTAMQNAMNAVSPEHELDPAILSDLVVRGEMAQDDATSRAAKSGYKAVDFDYMVKGTGEPPSVIDMLQLFRRGEVDRATVEKAIRQSRVKDEWIETVLKLGIEFPTPSDVINATLKGQIDDAAGRELFVKLGGADQYFQLMVDTVGDAPSPDQAASMARRGIIPWDGVGPEVTSFEQAVREGHWRNKWTAAYKTASQYTPPPRTISAMHSSGALTDAEATDWLRRAGVPEVLIPNYLKDANATKNAKAKNLAESTVQTLFMAHAIDESQAIGFLKQLGYNQTDAEFNVQAFTLARDLTARNTAINTVHSNYVGHKIDQNKATTVLDGIGVPSNQRDYLIKTWNDEKQAKVSVLTAAETKKAWKDGLIGDDDVRARLANMGYAADDIELYLAI